MASRQVSWNVANLEEDSSKARRLLEIIDSAADDSRKVLVFTFFLNTAYGIANLLGDKCVGMINGSVPPAKRQEIVEEFDAAEPGSVLVAQIQSGGTGMNIQCASVVVFCEPQYKPSIENQAVSRAYRMGQTRSVLAFRLLCENTVDEHILEIIRDKQKIFDAFADKSSAAAAAAEQDIADRLAMLTRRGKQTARNLDKNIQILELAQGFAYAPLQKEAIRKAMTENCLVLTGGPGTGKTTTVNAILQLLENEAERVALCAPTGRAAKRLSELTGRKASTIHRLLEVDYTGGVVSFIHNDKNLLKCDVVILDEMSMVDVKLFQALIAALRYSCRIIMVGDADQLPSVGPGNILGETIRSGLVPTVCLNEIFRQAAQSLIVENAHHIISGEPLKKGGKTDDFFFLEADGDAAQKLVCDLVTTRLPRSYQFDPVKDIQVLCPTKLGPTGTQALNAELQAMLNPPKKGKPELQSAARVFRVGDKVMQVRNNYEITWQRIGGEQGVGAYNGDIGIVESIDVRSRSMVVRMDDRRLVYPAENLNELEIAYAITVHKSQGSEFPAVILPAAQVPPRLCYRNLFYTGVTRGRKLCIVVGRRDVVNRMMSNIRQNLRYSGLAALLAEALPPEQENL